MSRPTLTVVALTVSLLLTSCPSPDIAPEASAELEAIVVEAWDAADAGELDLATDLLDELRDRARAHAAAGDVTGARLDRILTSVDEVEGLLEGLEDEPEPDEPAPEPEPDPDPEPEPGERKQKGKQKGKDG